MDILLSIFCFILAFGFGIIVIFFGWAGFTSIDYSESLCDGNEWYGVIVFNILKVTLLIMGLTSITTMVVLFIGTGLLLLK